MIIKIKLTDRASHHDIEKNELSGFDTIKKRNFLFVMLIICL